MHPGVRPQLPSEVPLSVAPADHRRLTWSLLLIGLALPLLIGGERLAGLGTGPVETFPRAEGMAAAVNLDWFGHEQLPAAIESRAMSRFAQVLAVLAGFAIKPLYMLLTATLAACLWRARDPDLTALRWAMVAFFVGEAFCAANYLACGERSHLLEYLHMAGMASSFAFVTYAVLEGVDRRLIRFSAPSDRCAALSLCHRCIKHANVPCALRRVFAGTLPALMVVAWMPLGYPPTVATYQVEILGSTYTYSHALLYQLYEARFCPLWSLTLLTASWVLLLARGHTGVPAAKLLLAAGLGPLGFGLVRLFLVAAYREQQVWQVFWEELTELLFVASAAWVLYLFRHGLFHDRPRASAPQS